MKPIHTLKGEQQILCLTEEGLYFFLGRSDKPKALPFQKWVYGEVLPQIRKTGAYAPKPEDLIREVVGRHRFMLWFNHSGKMGVQLIENDAFVGNIGHFIDYITSPCSDATDDNLRDLAEVCIRKLHSRASNRREMHQRLMELDPKNYDPMKNNKPVVPTKQFLEQKGSAR